MGEISANSDVKDTFCLLSEMVLKSMYCVSQRFKFVFFPSQLIPSFDIMQQYIAMYLLRRSWNPSPSWGATVDVIEKREWSTIVDEQWRQMLKDCIVEFCCMSFVLNWKGSSYCLLHRIKYHKSPLFTWQVTCLSQSTNEWGLLLALLPIVLKFPSFLLRIFWNFKNHFFNHLHFFLFLLLALRL